MKNWTAVSKQIDHDRRNIYPFAGLYPTRWKIEAEYSFARGRGPFRKYEYLGKPNSIVAEHVFRILTESSRGRIRAWEFDRGGVLIYGTGNLPRVSLIAMDYLRQMRFYYPLMALNGAFLTTWRRPMHRVWADFEEHKCALYVQSAPDTIGSAHWREFELWLNQENFVWGKRESNSTSSARTP